MGDLVRSYFRSFREFKYVRTGIESEVIWVYYLR